ncbi:ECs_2282 family putative zinc-binding protein [Virgibacillus ihumii]|uniref:ECs_2282 family putative zinc-binding protein n=1 Tax=Virgibacillus ihumii TaxID=2686091 RepID=UPI001C2CF0BE|nr:hypothetical protein [Virgibacillus ihumii]
MKDINRQVNLKCEVCGNDQFSGVKEDVEDLSSAPDDTEIKCSDCGRHVTKEQLFEENEYVINANMEDLEKDLMKEAKKEFKNMFKGFK